MSPLWILLFLGLYQAQAQSGEDVKLDPRELADLINTIYSDQEKVKSTLLMSFE